MDGIQDAIQMMVVQSAINKIVEERVNDSRFIEGNKLEELEIAPIPFVFSLN